jgi:hypothetical protein
MTGIHPSIDLMAARMKPLPPRHRIAHLRALIGLEPADSARRHELIALLRGEWSTRPANENRAP